MNGSLRRLAPALALPAIMLAGVTCSDSGTSSGPSTGLQHATLSITAALPASGSEAATVYRTDNLDVDRVRVIVLRLPADTLKDTTAMTTPGQTTLTVRLDVAASVGEQLVAALEFRSGSMVLFSGQAPVVAQGVDAGTGTTPPVTISGTPAAPGANAANITVTPSAGSFPISAAVPFSARTLATDGTSIPNAVLAWSVDDPTVGAINGATGVVQPTSKGGTLHVRATAANGVFGEGIVSFSGGPDRIATVSGDGQTGEVGVALAAPFVVQVLSGATPVSGQTVVFGSAGGGIASPSSVTTDASGRAQTTITPGSTIGSYSFVASVGALSTSISVTATAGAPASLVALSGSGQSDTVHKTLKNPLVVRVSDRFGNPVSGATVTWRNSGAGTLSAASTTTGPDGQASVTFTLSGQVGTESLTASVNGIATPASFSVSAIAGGASTIGIISGNAQSGAAGTTLPNPLVVQITNVNGSIAPGAAVAWLVTSGTATLTSVQSLSGTDGRASASVALGTTSGVVSVTATTGSQSVTFTESITGGTPTTLSLASGGGQTAAAGSALTAIAVKVVDAPGNPVANVNVTFAVASGGGSVVAANQTTDAQGLARATWTLGPTVGTQTLTASSAGLTGSPLTISATATSAPVLTAVALAFQSQPGSATAGSALTPAVTVAAVDANGHVVTTYSTPVTITILANPGSSTLGGTIVRTPVSGIASFNDLTLSAAGSGYTLSATSGTLTSATSAPFAIAAAGGGGTATRTWTGAVSTDWNVSGNWSGGVPTSTSNVVIPATTHNQPALTTAVSINDLSVAGGAALTIGAFTLTSSGNITGDGHIGGTGLVAMTGAGATFTDTLPNLDVYGSVSPASLIAYVPGNVRIFTGGTLSIPSGTRLFDVQSMTVPAGTLAVTGGSLIVSGLSVTGSGIFSQTAGMITVNGATFAGSSTAGLITGGILKLDGNFVQSSVVSTQSFAASGSHQTQFAASGPGTITFQDPGASHFQDMVLEGPGNVVLLTNVVATGQLIVPTNAQVTGSPHLLNVSGLNVAEMYLNGPLLTSTGGTITRFDNVTADNYSTSATPITIAHPGAASPFTFNNLAFDVTPVTGSYLNVTDTSPGDGNVLTINLLNSTPTDGSSLTTTSGGAVVHWGPVGGTIHWTNSLGGLWSTASNWNLGRVPIATDTVLIDAPGTYTVSLNAAFTGALITVGGATGVQTLATNANLTINNGLLIQSSGVFAPTSQSILGPGTLTNQGTMVVNGQVGLFIQHVVTTAASIVRIQPDGSTQSASLQVNISFMNNGRIELTSTGGAFSAAVSVTAQQTLTNGSTGTIATLAAGGGHAEVDGVVVNNGSISVGETTGFGGLSEGLTNNGVINVTGGDMNFSHAVLLNAGTITISPSRTLSIDNFSFTQQPGATLNGGGALSIVSATVTFGSPFTLSALSLQGVTANLSFDISTASVALTLSASTINGPGTIVNASGQSLSMTATTIAATSALSNQGALVVNATNTINGPLTTGAGSLIQLLATPTIQGATVGSATLTVANGFTNNGSIQLSSVGGVYPSQVTVTSGTLTNASGGTIATLTGGGGTRTIQGAVNNQGTITIVPTGAGVLALNGTLTNSGAINLELGGTGAAQFDALQVSGAVTLSGGTLNVALINGFTPATGNAFPLITYSGVSGDFAAYNLPGGVGAWTKASPPAGTVLMITKN